MTVIIYGISLAAVSLGLRLIVSPKRERDGMKRIYGLTAVSYTHLDVYKRQHILRPLCDEIPLGENRAAL